MKRPVLRLPVLALLLALVPHQAPADPLFSLSLDGGGLVSMTRLPGLSCAAQIGAQAQASLTMLSRSLEAELNGPEHGDPGIAVAGTASLKAGVFEFGQSGIAGDGNLYRGFWGFGAGASLGFLASGFRAPFFRARPASLRFEAGAGLRVAKYTGTGLIFAYASAFGQLSYEMPLGRAAAVSVGIPFEAAFRSGGVMIIGGVSVSIRTGWAKPVEEESAPSVAPADRQ